MPKEFSRTNRVGDFIKQELASLIQRELRDPRIGGAHGFLATDSSMHALFIASGPAFRSGATVAPFRNVHVYELICAVLGLRPAPNDGSLDSVRTLLR